MGKELQLLPSQLTAREGVKLQRMIKEFETKLRKDIDDKYPDGYQRTQMMDDSVTAAKNVVLRKIKYYKKKKQSLPDFIRKAK